MKTLVIPGLRLEVDAFEDDSEEEAIACLKACNDMLNHLSGSPFLVRHIPHGSAVPEEAFYEERPGDDDVVFLVVPLPDPNDPKPYPGRIAPGDYTRNEVVELLRAHRENPNAIQFIADMLEE